MKNNLIFIGMPAVGKSSVGIVIAKRLRMKFIDTDLLIQEQENKFLREIINEKGKQGFLAIENQVNLGVNPRRAVISPGGSIVYCKEAMEHYKKIGTVVYLQASYPTIRRRIRSLTKRGVVLEEGQTFRQLYHERSKLFEKYADVTVSCDDSSMEETIALALRRIRKYWRYLRNKERRRQAREQAEKATEKLGE